MRQHGAACDEGVRPDFLTRQDDRADSQSSAAPHRSSLVVFVSIGRATGKVVVAGEHAGGNEYAVFEMRIGRDIGIRFELAVLPDGARILNRDTASHYGARADRYSLPNRCEVSHEDVFRQRTSGIDDGANPDAAPRSDPCRREFGGLRQCAVGGPHRLLPQCGAVAYTHVVSDDCAAAKDYMVSNLTLPTNYHVVFNDAEHPDCGTGIDSGSRRNHGGGHDGDQS